MSSPSGKPRGKSGRKVRVPFRSNRAARRRRSDWTQQARDAEDHEIDAERSESVTAKGELSRRRTVVVPDGDEVPRDSLQRGTVVAMRGLYAEVDDGKKIWQCTVRRVLRTRLIEERHPVTVGDHVQFLIESEGEGVAQEGVIEAVDPRCGELRRRAGRRVHTIVANVDQAIIVSSADQPSPKPHLIDRYIVAALAGEITPVICMNKLDLDHAPEQVAEGDRAEPAQAEGCGLPPAREVLERYSRLGYRTLYTSALTGEGVDDLRDVLKGKASVIAGQSGVGKSSLLNGVQPGLQLKIGDIIEQTTKGRHTTSTASLLRLDVGGYVVDTPGVRSFDLSTVGRHELEALFEEFVDHVPNCKFPDCTHIHEDDCAVRQAVERGDIHPERYESYVRIFEEPPA
jgi:ribosome biogenesis GTPase